MESFPKLLIMERSARTSLIFGLLLPLGQFSILEEVAAGPSKTYLNHTGDSNSNTAGV